MKLGFIDYFLDEFHANKYPAWINDASGGEIQVAYAYAEIDSPKGGLTTGEWCEKNAIRKIDTIDELVGLSDGIIVLSPDNPERHEELGNIPLRSGKRVFVDKTFAETKEVAKRIFEVAEAHGTPCYSSSALRFADEYKGIGGCAVENIASWGPGTVAQYGVHQIEPIVSLMGPDVARVQFTGTDKWPAYLCEFANGNRAAVSHHGWECPFSMAVGLAGGETKMVTVESDFFMNFIRELVGFFRTGEVKVPHGETISIIATIEAAVKASRAPGCWVNI